MLAVYSVGIFFVDTWWGMAAYAAMFAVALCASGADARKVFGIAVPVYVICAFTVVFNMFPAVEGVVGFSATGLVRGCFFAARILLLVWTSLVLCATTDSMEMTRAFESFLSPLRALRVPVNDIATVFSIALRFIPLMVEEFFAIRDVQWSRGAKLGEGRMSERLKANFVIFIPMFVGMFRRADRLALAMDARCYGMPEVVPVEIRETSLNATSIIVGVCTVTACIVTSVLL